MDRKNINSIALMASACLVIFSALNFTGCKVSSDYCKPDTAVHDKWVQPLGNDIEVAHQNINCWWKVFNDPTLENYIKLAGQRNIDLKTAIARISEAKAARAFAAGEKDIQLDGTGGYKREKLSRNGPYAPASGDTDQTNDHMIGFDSSWEIDLFGRISRNIESAQAAYEASIEDYRDVLVSLYAEVAQNYIQIRSLQLRIDYAKNNIEIQEKTLALTQDRFKAGLVPRLDVSQAQLNLSVTQSQIPDLEAAITESINRLSVLLDESPTTIREQVSEQFSIPKITRNIEIGLPVDLLRQRPDIRSAERNLASQVAKVGSAQAQLYPSFSLSGTFALDATNMNDLGDISSRAYSFGPSLRIPILNGDRIKSNIAIEQARAQQSLTIYNNTLLKAYEEVENALSAYVQENDKNKSLLKSVEASQKSVELVQTLYKSGLTDFQNVLDMQRSLTNQQDQYALSKGNVLINVVRIYKALGGGWSDTNIISQ